MGPYLRREEQAPANSRNQLCQSLGHSENQSHLVKLIAIYLATEILLTASFNQSGVFLAEVKVTVKIKAVPVTK